MSERWHVCLAGWQKVAWALDEDLRWVRRALNDHCCWSALPLARIVHAAWPAAVKAIPAGALRGKTVVCQADNPPAFYLGDDVFAAATPLVNLWIARSGEALSQFHCLGLPAARVPYCVDPGVFRPLPDRAGIRRSLGLPEKAFVIGNFHRDSEGADLERPKRQKGPDLFLQIARGLKERVPGAVVLLAGPRRHWLLGALRDAEIPVVFAGREPGEGDDFQDNVLPRERLNELYQALDVCVVSSRWEGGPYSVLEALAAGTTVISTPVGTARDVLLQACLFRTVGEAVDLLATHAERGLLSAPCAEAAASAAHTHSPAAVRDALLHAYGAMPVGRTGIIEAARSAWALVSGRVVARTASRDESLRAMVKTVRDKSMSLCGEVDFIDCPDYGTQDNLIECAARIAAARNAK